MTFIIFHFVILSSTSNIKFFSKTNPDLMNNDIKRDNGLKIDGSGKIATFKSITPKVSSSKGEIFLKRINANNNFWKNKKLI